MYNDIATTFFITMAVATVCIPPLYPTEVFNCLVSLKVGFMVPVERRYTATLLPIIHQHIAPGTTVL